MCDAEHEREVDAEGDGSEREREVADHRLAMFVDATDADGGVGHQARVKPEHGQNAEAEMRGKAAFGKDSEHETGDRAYQNRDQVQAAEPAVEVEIFAAETAGELPGAEEQRPGAAEDVSHEQGVVFAEVPARGAWVRRWWIWRRTLGISLVRGSVPGRDTQKWGREFRGAEGEHTRSLNGRRAAPERQGQR